ncbi:MAG: FtsW/RodA/SpoVE family cell cycle protein [Fimbriimonadaceae bacterium]
MATYAGFDAYRSNEQSRALKRIDWWLLAAAGVLLGFGLLALYSYGLRPGGGHYLRKQELNVFVGLIPATLFASVDPKFWLRSATVLYVVNVLALVAIFKVGTSINGSARWINLGPIQFQPSEMAKLVSVLTVASFYAMRQEHIKKLSTFLLGLVHIAVPMLLILKQPHVGGAVTLFVIWLAISVVARVPGRFLVVTGLCVGVALPLFMHGYNLKRIKAFLPAGLGQMVGARANASRAGAKLPGSAARSAQRSQQGIDYQTDQARMAFGVGGVVGTGIGRGQQGENIPEQETDFVFTIIGEELGLVGCTLVLAAFAFLFYRIWLVMYRATDNYYRMVVAGVLGMLAFHTFVNLFMVTQMLPVIGLWLPFFSYGGTAMWLCMSAVALVLNVRARERPILFG